MIERCFNELCDLPLEARDARLLELLPTDPAMRSEVLELLRADDKASRGEGVSATEIKKQFDEAVTSGVARAHDDPTSIGDYRILGRLGAGGMGVVYEAEQPSPRRRVALKVLRPGLFTPELIRRFQFEAEALGRLRHPAIAQIYEAGVTHDPENARPFFAMELVQGAMLIDWLVDRSTAERLAMVADICDAVQHAHARGVIHRDLKPGNIMVSDEGQPKVLDFGVARALDADPAAGGLTEHTQAGQLIGTLPYMSPEQVSGDPRETDIRCDVYALGVLLFESLTGHTPHELDGAGLLESADIIRGTDATRLARVDTRFRGDLDVIAAKALERDRDRRYQTAAELGDDIRRYLSGQTITARPASAVYLLSRVAKRHLPVTVASGIALATLVAAVVVISIALNDSIAQRIEADRRAGIAEAVTSFLNNDLLAAVSPDALGYDATIREALDLAAERIPERFEAEPVTGAAIRNNIANVYHALGDFAAAAAFATESRDLFLAELGESHELTRFAQQDIGSIKRDMGQFEESRAALRTALAMRERTVGPRAPETLENLVMLAEIERDGFGRYADAEKLLDEFEARSEGVLNPDDRIAVYADMTRGGLALAARDYERAAAAYTRVAKARRTIFGPTHSATLTAEANLAVALEGLGRYDEVEPIYLRVLEIEERTGGKDSPDRLPTAHNLAFLYHSMGRFDEAESLLVDTLERCRRVFGPVHPGTLTCVQSLSALYRDTDRLDDAVSLLQDSYTTATTELGEASPPALEIGPKLAVMYTELGRPADAEPVFARTVAALADVLPQDHPYVGRTRSQWAVALHRVGRTAEAVQQLEQAYEILAAAPGEDQAADAQLAATRLATMLESLGQSDKAAEWKARSQP